MTKIRNKIVKIIIASLLFVFICLLNRYTLKNWQDILLIITSTIFSVLVAQIMGIFDIILEKVNVIEKYTDINKYQNNIDTYHTIFLAFLQKFHSFVYKNLLNDELRQMMERFPDTAFDIKYNFEKLINNGTLIFELNADESHFFEYAGTGIKESIRLINEMEYNIQAFPKELDFYQKRILLFKNLKDKFAELIDIIKKKNDHCIETYVINFIKILNEYITSEYGLLNYSKDDHLTKK